jgi:integrase
MPAEQEGTTYKTKTAGIGIRWFDENGMRRRKTGFTSESKARKWLRDVEFPRMRGDTITPTPTTLGEHVDRYLDAHTVGRDPKTIDVLRFRLAYASRVFGDLQLHELERRVPELAAWTTTLPAGSRYGIVQALRQCLEAAVRWNLIKTNPAKRAGTNPQPERDEVQPFEPDEVEKIAAELGATYGAVAIIGAHCGLRPSELVALEWRDVSDVITVERAFSYGQVKSPKTKGSRRRVPVPSRAQQALEGLPRTLRTRLVFPAPRGAHIDIRNWRKREWQPALEAAGLWVRPAKGQVGAPCPRPYTLRHTYATWSLSAGVPAYDVARYMGTSVRMLDLTYGHLIRGSEEVARDRLDAFTSGRSGQEVATS